MDAHPLKTSKDTARLFMLLFCYTLFYCYCIWLLKVACGAFCDFVDDNVHCRGLCGDGHCPGSLSPQP